jgi:predicted nicotinamide N-methyase
MLPNGPFALYIPDQDAIKQLIASGSNATGEVPYWSKIWPAAIALATYLQQNEDLIRGKIVAELGAGLGLPSLVASHLATSVWCSDIKDDAVRIAEKSAVLQGLTNVRFAVCDWNKIPDDFVADLVLLSDINYKPDLFENLEKLVGQLLAKGCTLLLSTPQRLMAKPFMDKMLPFSVSQTIESVKENGQITYISIFTLKINA